MGFSVCATLPRTRGLSILAPAPGAATFRLPALLLAHHPSASAKPHKRAATAAPTANMESPPGMICLDMAWLLPSPAAAGFVAEEDVGLGSMRTGETVSCTNVGDPLTPSREGGGGIVVEMEDASGTGAALLLAPLPAALLDRGEDPGAVEESLPAVLLDRGEAPGAVEESLPAALLGRGEAPGAVVEGLVSSTWPGIGVPVSEPRARGGVATGVGVGMGALQGAAGSVAVPGAPRPPEPVLEGEAPRVSDAVALALTVEEALGVHVDVGVAEPVALPVGVGVELLEREMLGVMLGDAPAVRLGVALRDCVKDALTVDVGVDDGVPVELGVSLPVGLDEALPVAVLLPVPLSLPVTLAEAPRLSEDVGEEDCVLLPDRVEDGVAAGVLLLVPVDVPVSEGVGVAEAVQLDESDRLPVALGDAPTVRLEVLLADCVEEALGVVDGVGSGVMLLVPVGLPVLEGVGVAVGERLLERDTLGVLLGDAPEDRLGVALKECVTDALKVDVGVAKGVPVGLGVSLPVGLDVALPVAVQLPVPLSLPVPLDEAPRLSKAVGEADCVLLSDRVADGDNVEEPLRVPGPEAVPVGEGVGVAEAVQLDESDWLPVALGEAPTVRLGVLLADCVEEALGVEDWVGSGVMLPVPVGLPVLNGVCEAVNAELVDRDTLGVLLGDAPEV